MKAEPLKTIPYRCGPSKHRALKSLAAARRLSMQKLIDQVTDLALAERQAEARFRKLQAEAPRPAEAAALLAKIQKRHERAAKG